MHEADARIPAWSRSLRRGRQGRRGQDVDPWTRFHPRGSATRNEPSDDGLGDPAPWSRHSSQRDGSGTLADAWAPPTEGDRRKRGDREPEPRGSPRACRARSWVAPLLPFGARVADASATIVDLGRAASTRRRSAGMGHHGQRPHKRPRSGVSDPTVCPSCGDAASARKKCQLIAPLGVEDRVVMRWQDTVRARDDARQLRRDRRTSSGL